MDRVCIVGSGNWGSAIATIVGRNCRRLPFVEDRVSMWVFEEMVQLPPPGDNGQQQQQQQQQLLSELINERHENVKYLPGIALPETVVAVPDLATACRNATLLLFVLPHQFLPRLLPIIRTAMHPTRCRAVSLIKGLGAFVCVFVCVYLRYAACGLSPLVDGEDCADDYIGVGACVVCLTVPLRRVSRF